MTSLIPIFLPPSTLQTTFVVYIWNLCIQSFSSLAFYCHALLLSTALFICIDYNPLRVIVTTLIIVFFIFCFWSNIHWWNAKALRIPLIEPTNLLVFLCTFILFVVVLVRVCLHGHSLVVVSHVFCVCRWHWWLSEWLFSFLFLYFLCCS